MSKVDPCLFVYKTVIFVVYVDYCLFWARSQSEIDNVMNSSKEGVTSYNWGKSEGESVSELLVIDIKTFDDVLFQFYQNGLIYKALEATLMEHRNWFPKSTKVEAPLGTDANVSEA